MQDTIVINKISPHYSIDKLASDDINDLIDIFEDRMIYWILDPASFLLKYEYNEQCITHLIINYFEIFAMYLSGEDSDRKSKIFFKRGFIEVYKNSHPNLSFLEKLADNLYRNARNGFFHTGFGKKRLFLSTVYDEPFRVTLPYNDDKSTNYNGEIGDICINSHLLLRDVSYHFNDFMKLLRNPSNHELRSNFRKTFLRISR